MNSKEGRGTQFVERGNSYFDAAGIRIQAQDETRQERDILKEENMKKEEIQSMQKQLDRRDKVNICTAPCFYNNIIFISERNFRCC